ncbi:LysR family transcriptional regulator [Hoeflea prorocentri]|uniref:LysR family transcriptional regulator n=1 Tax=Hoeflea prorocentri TaxID=1922333 RepID=A0A9X3ULP1_9HYPH|nr:LysR family transcriptional regulator [Hoeflea prorocentri]MCY6382856.1 LysR family transcriptional regulator [Hoeflea prorocentri]MDA5400656.1 LysR family transcriptional regulator [Hoeflea prorocentri]
MEIASLKTVLLVQSQGSIAAAARALDLDPSSVSRIVATVEADLGVRLFQRTTRRLTVTEEGQVFLTRLAPMLEEIEAAQEDARGLRSKPTGLLRLTASVAFAHHMILPLLPAFQELYPDISIDLQSSDANLDLVEHGIDLAIRLAPAPTGDLVSTRLMKTRYHVVASPNYLDGRAGITKPTDLEQLNCIRFALPGLRDRWMFQSGASAPFEVPVRGDLRISNALALRRAACMGLGVAMLADWLIQDDLRDGRLVALFPDFRCAATEFETAAWALYPNRAYLPQKVRVMIDFLRSNMRTAVG